MLEGLVLRGRLNFAAGSMTGVGRGGTTNIPPAGGLLPACSESSPALGVVSLLSFSRSDGWGTVSHCGARLCFPDEGCCRRVMSPSAVRAIDRAFQKGSCKAFARFPLSLFLSEGYESAACVLGASPVSDTRVTSAFSQSGACHSTSFTVGLAEHESVMLVKCVLLNF